MHAKPFPVKTLAMIVALVILHFVWAWFQGSCGIETCVGPFGHFSTSYAYLVLAFEALAMLILVLVFLWKMGRSLMSR